MTGVQTCALPISLPVELYQRSWRGDSNADHGLTRPALFPLSYTSANSGGGGENCTPDDLLCRQMPCCLGYATSQLWSGRRDSNPRSRRWQRRVLAARRLPHGASSESRTRVIGLEARGTSRYTMLAMAGDEGLEPSYLVLEASVLAAERISRNSYGGRNGSRTRPS